MGLASEEGMIHKASVFGVLTKAMMMNASLRRAFSLIEMMVALGIVGLLLLILLPVIGRARHASKTVLCAAHLQQLGQVMLVYVTDNDGVVPYATIRVNSTWDVLIAPAWGGSSPAVGLSTPKPSPVLSCPEDTLQRPDWAGYSPTAVRSYAMPQAPVSYTGELLYGIGAVQWLPEYPIEGFRAIRLSQVKRPSQYLLLVENPGSQREDGTSENIAGNRVGSWVDAPSGQTRSHSAGPQKGLPITLPVHGRAQWNYLFCDGHVDLLRPLETVEQLPGMSEGETLNGPSGFWRNNAK
jgi:prepilin-type N-terminal cleavage/methylation domain-containing protein/prepilin-type processing-associated H-X9-DG protein